MSEQPTPASIDLSRGPVVMRGRAWKRTVALMAFFALFFGSFIPLAVGEGGTASLIIAALLTLFVGAVIVVAFRSWRARGIELTAAGVRVSSDVFVAWPDISEIELITQTANGATWVTPRIVHSTPRRFTSLPDFSEFAKHHDRAQHVVEVLRALHDQYCATQ